MSQAENEKLKKGNLTIDLATQDDIESIANLEKDSISVNTLTIEDIQDALNNPNYETIKAEFNSELVGFLMLQFTDEASVVSIAVDKIIGI